MSTLDLHNTPRMVFGDDESAARYEREVAAAKAVQRVPYAVAPRQRVTTRRRTFEAGQEITVADLDLITGGESALIVMRRLVSNGLVTEADHIPRIVPKPVAVVAPGKAITSPHGILAPGDGIAKDDFDSATLARLVERGLAVLS